MQNNPVKKWMTRDVITISPDTPLPEADRLMIGKKIRRLPVVKNGRLVGIVTRNNLWGATYSDAVKVNLYELNYILSHSTVARVMTLDPVVVSPETPLREAVALMLENKFSGLPVVDEAGHVVGIITESDLFRIMAQDWLSQPEEPT
jgi:acetoin utilization protein AcuB